MAYDTHGNGYEKKRILLILLFIVLSGAFINCLSPQQVIEKTLVDRAVKNLIWKLVWHDEFTASPPLQDNWYIDINDYGGGNQELQYYTNREKNVHIEDGMLHIIGLKEDYLTREYTSARLTTQDAWTYGRFEVRAKLPEGQGIWPAIWLISDTEPYGPWPTSGEVDIIINLAIGGTWPGDPNEDTVFPQEFVIDYVRVYQRW